MPSYSKATVILKIKIFSGCLCVFVYNYFVFISALISYCGDICWNEGEILELHKIISEYIGCIPSTCASQLHNWSLYHKKGIADLEKVQRATKVMRGLQHLPSEENLKCPGLISLERGRYARSL